MSTLLSLNNVTVRFGGLVAVNKVSIDVAEGAIHSLIGPNGAGKTTIINTVTGVYRPTEGSVTFAGKQLAANGASSFNAQQICALGLTRTFQNTELFGELSLADNVAVGLHRIRRYGLLAAGLRLPARAAGEAWIRDRVDELLDLVGLLDQREVEARYLPFSQMRRLELARALASEPRMLLLDEPAAGLRAGEIDDLNQILLMLRQRLGITILLVDHVMPVVMNVSDRITVVNFGARIAEGAPADIRADPAVIAAYLGH